MVTPPLIKQAKTIEAIEQQTLDAVLDDLNPDISDIESIDHGYDNLVCIIGREAVLRIPRTPGAKLKANLEAFTLHALEAHNVPNVPRILRVNDEPSYLVTSYIPGIHVNSEGVRRWPDEAQQQYGRRVAQFAHALQNSLDVEDILQVRAEIGMDQADEPSWDVYFEQTLLHGNSTSIPQRGMLRDYYAQWRSLSPTNNVVVHDDLHTHNILSISQQITGFLDFGLTGIGTVEQELRQLHRIGSLVLHSAIVEYEQLSGQQVNEEAVQLWAIIQEMAAYAECIDTQRTDHPSFRRAVKNLTMWLPEHNWNPYGQ